MSHFFARARRRTAQNNIKNLVILTIDFLVKLVYTICRKEVKKMRKIIYVNKTTNALIKNMDLLTIL